LGFLVPVLVNEVGGVDYNLESIGKQQNHHLAAKKLYSQSTTEKKNQALTYDECHT
jgi:hypothetical protein